MWNAKRWFARNLSPADAPFAVPIEAWSHRVGADFMRDLATRMGGRYHRNPGDIGLMDDFGIMRGRWFDPTRVHPQIVEFYEHTARFSLSVEPVWHRLSRPFFWLFREVVAEWIGQANLPFDLRDVQAGLESHLDCIDVDGDQAVDLRGWVRTYRGTDRVIYVGIYTAVRIDGLGYMSVGFPFPNANMTATLVPVNAGEHDMVLTTHLADAPVAGDYLVLRDDDTGTLSIIRLRGFHEEIRLMVRGERFLAEHRFSFLGRTFLTLKYTITRTAAPATPPVNVPARLLDAPTLDPAPAPPRRRRARLPRSRRAGRLLTPPPAAPSGT